MSGYERITRYSEYTDPDTRITYFMGHDTFEEIVRCRDCRHYVNGFCMEPDGNGGNKGWSMNPHGFCSDGEPKEVNA